MYCRNILFCSFLDLIPLRIEFLPNLFERHHNYRRANSSTCNKDSCEKAVDMNSGFTGELGANRVCALWLTNTLIFHLRFFCIRFALCIYKTTPF